MTLKCKRIKLVRLTGTTPIAVDLNCGIIGARLPYLVISVNPSCNNRSSVHAASDTMGPNANIAERGSQNRQIHAQCGQG